LKGEEGGGGEGVDNVNVNVIGNSGDSSSSGCGGIVSIGICYGSSSNLTTNSGSPCYSSILPVTVSDVTQQQPLNLSRVESLESFLSPFPSSLPVPLMVQQQQQQQESSSSSSFTSSPSYQDSHLSVHHSVSPSDQHRLSESPSLNLFSSSQGGIESGDEDEIKGEYKPSLFMSCVIGSVIIFMTVLLSIILHQVNLVFDILGVIYIYIYICVCVYVYAYIYIYV
jgi:hypothetical protein